MANAAYKPRSGDLITDLLAKWLNLLGPTMTGPNAPRPTDDQDVLLRKILTQLRINLGVTSAATAYSQGDSDWNILAKILTVLNP